MPKEQDNATHSLAQIKWNCKYHIIFAPKYRRKVFYVEKREAIREILRVLYTKAMQQYIANQLERDRKDDQLSLFDSRNPFTGSK